MAGKPTFENPPTIKERNKRLWWIIKTLVGITLGLPVTYIICQQRTCDSCENCGKSLSIGNYDLKRI